VDTLSRVLAGGHAQVDELVKAIDERIDEAIARAERSPLLNCDAVEAEKTDGGSLEFSPLSFPARSVTDGLRDALADSMADDERIVLLGEGICDPVGGPHGVTAGLSGRFGERVRNVPTSESAVVGVGLGLAGAGWRPIVAISPPLRLTRVAVQIIRHADSGPLVLRTTLPDGHSAQSAGCDWRFLASTGLRVLALNKHLCPGRLYRRLLADNDQPTLVVEAESLYHEPADPAPPAGCELSATDEPFPTVRVAPHGDRQLTIVTFGPSVSRAESAMATLAKQGVACDLLIPTQICPLSIESIVGPVAQTGRLLVVESGPGFGNELIACMVRDRRIDSLQAACVGETEPITNAAIKLIGR
jgi:pyruvate dehydrogenase E1 component beta subunit